MKDELTKVKHLRNDEYFRTDFEHDALYKKGLQNHKFYHLVEYIMDTNNIRLAYRNIKSNKGKNSKGISGKNLAWISSMKISSYIELVERRIKNYTPEIIRRVGIPKKNGKTRYLGIKEPLDKIIEQAILQILEPILTAKFHNNSNGFIKGRSTHRAIAQMENYIISKKLYFVVDIDIKGFFDNVNHGKLLKQLWSLGIRDKNLLSIISKMLKAEVFGIGTTEKGTPQGGILSPLLANVVLNELDWWLDSKKNLGVRIVRYADDFKILCPTYSIARSMLEKTKVFLDKRLKLEVSEEKTKIVNLKRNYSEFLGYKIKIKKYKNKYKIVSHINNKALDNIESKIRGEMFKIKKAGFNFNKLKKTFEKSNTVINGIHNYYDIATNVRSDLSRLNWVYWKYLSKRLGKVLYFSNKFSKSIKEKYCRCGKKIPCIRGTPIILIGDITYNFKLYKGNKINYYDDKSRENFHKRLALKNEYIIDHLLKKNVSEETVEFNDNIIPVFCGQYGRYKITGELIYNYNDINTIRIIKNGTDKYNNIAIVNNKVKQLLEVNGDDNIEIEQLKKGLNKEQLSKINKIRKENNLSLI